MKYVAVKIGGDIFQMNDRDELGGIIDNDIPHETLGEICDPTRVFGVFGENCNNNCEFFRSGNCPASVVEDIDGNPIHVLHRTIEENKNGDFYIKYSKL